MTKEKHMGNDMGVTVKRVGHADKVAVLFADLRDGFALFGTIPHCRERLNEALRQLAHIEVNWHVDARVAELENEGE
jgi:hypothetical protein